MDRAVYKTVEITIDEPYARHDPGPTIRAGSEEARGHLSRAPYGWAWKCVDVADRGYCQAEIGYGRVIRFTFEQVANPHAREKFHANNRVRWLAYRRAG